MTKIRFTSVARQACAAFTAALVLAASGCTSPSQYIHNGFKVGPNYASPAAPVAEHWIDTGDVRVHETTEDISRWWTVFHDPMLNDLVVNAYRQNLTLRAAGFRILEARATLGIAEGNFFPQTQTLNGSYTRGAVKGAYFNTWSYGFNMAWQVDFWGRFRRAITAADAQLDSSVESYDDVLVTLLGDVATNYIEIRTDQERIKYLQENVEVQRLVVDVGKQRLGAGAISEVVYQQALSNLKATEAAIPLVAIDLREAANRLCILMGIPPREMERQLGIGRIPYTPVDVAAGIPADLLRRRPDVRKAERDAAAQAEMIGIAQADYYPAISVLGTLGGQANSLAGLFTSKAFTGSIGPQFQWDILNYGRLVNNVRLQDAKFQELIATYQQTVLNADGDVENGLVTFLRSQQRAQELEESVKAGTRARDITLELYKQGEKGFDFNSYALIEQNLITEQDTWVQARGQIATGLIQVYQALGGGWQIRCQPVVPAAAGPEVAPLPSEVVPAPSAEPLPVSKDRLPVPELSPPAVPMGPVAPMKLP